MDDNVAQDASTTEVKISKMKGKKKKLQLNLMEPPDYSNSTNKQHAAMQMDIKQHTEGFICGILPRNTSINSQSIVKKHSVSSLAGPERDPAVPMKFHSMHFNVRPDFV